MEKDRRLEAVKTDQPAFDDLLSINHHVQGLSQFMMECPTPLTISIQGEWGSGKSSLIKQLIKEIEQKDKGVVNIVFDTWQFSQFSLDEDLSEILLNRLLAEINVQASFRDSEERKRLSEKVQDTLKEVRKKKVKKFAGAFEMAVSDIVHEKYGLDLEKIKKEMKEDSSKEDETADLYQQVNDLKANFKSLVDKVEEDRIIFYIDDLDRLAPEKAVELLEVIKVFLDVEKCIFILAIDYEVVVRGVASKYGFDMRDAQELEKGKDFFDKLIQVSYSVPLGDYDFTKLIQEFLGQEGLLSDQIRAEAYQALLVNSVGRNPRSIKRILNTFKLNLLIGGSLGQSFDEKSALVLFSFMCLQVAYPGLYSYIFNRMHEVPVKALLNQLLEEGEKDPALDSEISRPACQEFLRDLKGLSHGMKKDFLHELVHLSANTFVARKTERKGGQNRTPNRHVQYVMRKMYNRLAGEELFDLRNLAVDLNREERLRPLDSNWADLLGFDYVELTSGKGQGIYLIKGNPDRPSYRIYFSGDWQGNLPNDGMRLLVPGEKDWVLGNASFVDSQRERFQAIVLEADPEKFEEFFEFYLDKVQEVKRVAYDSYRD